MEKVQELYVILEDRPGALGELSELLGKNKINIETIAVFGDSAKLLVKNINKTKKMLEKNGYTVELRDVLRVEIDNKPGELAYLTQRIGHIGINIDLLFVSIKPGDKTVSVVLDVSDPDMAMTLFK